MGDQNQPQLNGERSMLAQQQRQPGGEGLASVKPEQMPDGEGLAPGGEGLASAKPEQMPDGEGLTPIGEGLALAKAQQQRQANHQAPVQADDAPLAVAPRLARLLQQLRDAGRPAVAFTGAGISTASGIPDFRSPGTGLWERVNPEEAMSLASFQRDAAHFYEIALQTWLPPLWAARPNPAHRALARLERAGLLAGVITQNIDGLHQAAGSRLVFEVHGSARTASCPRCGRSRMPLPVGPAGYPPLCPECGAVLKPDITLFGEPLPPAFAAAWDLAGRCALIVVIGSSLEVAPAAYIPERVGRLIINNLQPTAYDDRAEMVVRASAAAFWPAVAAAVR